MSWINKLSPVTYRWDKRSWYAKDLSVTPDGSKKRNQLHIGFLAQEHLEVEKEHGFGDGKENMLVTDLTEDGNRYGMKYERLVPVLVNAIKDLSAKVEELESNSGGTTSSSSSSAIAELKSLIKGSKSFAALKTEL